ncbi:MAG: AraC family transcriptional regulator [Myxococcaceae bacterium]|nr:AraC family transcriptional regulator [Myxococcaceae bacterium]
MVLEIDAHDSGVTARHRPARRTLGAFAMLEEVSTKDFERSPLGRYAFTASCVVWCASPALCGWQIWGRPDEAETRVLLRLLDQHSKLAPTFRVVADARKVELVSPTALPLLAQWYFRHRSELRRRIALQANVIRRDSVGFLLIGLVISMGDAHPFCSFTEPLEAFRSVAGEAGAALCEEVEAIVKRVRSVPHELQVLRACLAARPDATIEEVSKELSISRRSLQRVLGRAGTSFHDEMTTARFEAARTLLDAADLKVSAVAARVGWSERTLTTVFRARTGLTPADWRKREPR